MPISASLIRKLEAVPQQIREVLIDLVEEIERRREESVTKREFNELKEIVRELAKAQRGTEQQIKGLAEAQKRTEERLLRLEGAVEKLAEAQGRTEERLSRLEQTVERLAEAQKKTEERVEELAEAQRSTEERLNRLEQAVERLAEAQRRTEERVNELAEAQRRTEERISRLEVTVEELAQAQKRTEQELQLLIAEHRKTREQVGGLSITVGYRLEDEAFKALPRLLERDYGIKVEGRLRRKFLRDNRGDYLEVNIIGEGRRNGERVTIVGEEKSQLSRREVDRFIRRKLKRLEGVLEGIFPVLVTYMISEPRVEEYVREKGIALYYSYDF